MRRRRTASSSTSEAGGTRRGSSSLRGRRKQNSTAEMRGEDEGQTKRKRVLVKDAVNSDEAKQAIRKMRENSGDNYYDVTRLEDPDRMIIFDIPEAPTVTRGEDGNEYTNLVPKKIVELEGNDIVEVYPNTSLKAPTVVINAIYGTKEKDQQIEDDDCYMSYANWEDFKKFNRKYHKVLWAAEGEGGFYEKVYNSVD